MPNTTMVPASRPQTAGRFDTVGAVDLSAALVSLLLAVSKGADWGWTSAPALGLGALALVLFIV
ncbi:hypothetical protein [Arthrobacter sp. KNU40]|uniref:hypothetical protein n=1 Tax=Arthrobacter sp. KNU40 TaxID=3447965 RepID=UPI003F5EBC10